MLVSVGIRYGRARARLLYICGFVFAVLTATPAFAQRANDNALASAEDAFGTTVGNETSGLYDPRNARGFSPQAAGNARIEGMYFDRPDSGPGDVVIDRLFSSYIVRVGLAAQSYPFPAPSGIIDVSLRIPRRDDPLTSVVATVGPYDTLQLEIDGQTPLIPGKLNMALGGKLQRQRNDAGGTAKNWSAGALFRLAPTDDIEIVPFWAGLTTGNSLNAPVIYSGGDWLPPEIPRGVLYQQEWAKYQQEETNFGVLARANLGEHWTLRTGLFRALYFRVKSNAAYYTNTQPDGMADLTFYSSPHQRYSSYSGEVRGTGIYTVGDFRHTIHLTLRARESKRLTGGTSIIYAGRFMVGEPDPVPRPNFVYTGRNFDDAKQLTGGALYDLQWRHVGGFSVGVQETTYNRLIAPSGQSSTTTTTNALLYNATWNARLTDTLTFFGSYARALEESGVAPQTARNRYQATAPSFTTQLDSGLSWAVTPNFKLMTSVYRIEKPYYDRDATNLFTNVGDLSHEGIEISATGQILPNLTMVTGIALLKGRVSGPLVDQGIIGSVPVGRDPLAMRISLLYAPPSWHGLSLDGQLEHINKGYHLPRNQADIPARNVVDLGMRYRFTAMDAPMTLRVRLQNVTDTFAWEYVSNPLNYLNYIPRRRVTASLAADF